MKKSILTLVLFILLFTINISTLTSNNGGENSQFLGFEELLIGTWMLQEVEIINIEDYVQSMIDMQIGMIDEEITTLTQQAETESDDSKKTKIQTEIENLENMKTQLSTEPMIEKSNNEFNGIIGIFQLIFYKDKTVKVLPDNKVNEWSVNENITELYITEIEHVTTFLILELSQEKLVLSYSQGEAENQLIVNMTFKKEAE